MANRNLSEAKKAKQDEFYTQMNDIQTEINAYLDYDENTFCGKTVLLPCDDPEWSNFTLFFAQNFERLGLKKLISTSYAPESKTAKYGSLFAYAASQSDETPKNERGKIFILDHDVNGIHISHIADNSAHNINIFKAPARVSKFEKYAD